MHCYRSPVLDNGLNHLCKLFDQSYLSYSSAITLMGTGDREVLKQIKCLFGYNEEKFNCV